MKRYIKSTDEFAAFKSNREVADFLKSKNIDNKVSTYELSGETYERYTRGKNYTRRFKCPGDWLAYLSMKVHMQPSAYALNEWFDGKKGLSELIDRCPTVADIEEYAYENWWGDGDDYIFSLKNLDTGAYLYSGDEAPDTADWED